MDHLILRLPPALVGQSFTIVPDESAGNDNKHFWFVVGQDRYPALLMNLSTTVEVHHACDTVGTLEKDGNVTQILQVFLTRDYEMRETASLRPGHEEEREVLPPPEEIRQLVAAIPLDLAMAEASDTNEIGSETETVIDGETWMQENQTYSLTGNAWTSDEAKFIFSHRNVFFPQGEREEEEMKEDVEGMEEEAPEDMEEEADDEPEENDPEEMEEEADDESRAGDSDESWMVHSDDDDDDDNDEITR